MKSWSFGLITVAVLLGMSNQTTNAASETGIDIGSRLELFVDRYLIDRLDGAALRLHSPQRTDVALRLDKPWEGIVSGYFTVIKDGDLYRMYYRGRPSVTGGDGAKEAEEVTCYAESQDGIHWTRPALGLFEVAGTKENNAILGYEHNPFTHNFCPFLDDRPGVPASERFKGVGGSSKTGLMAFVSADGIHWNRLREEPIITGGAFDSQNVVFWSPVEELYICYLRTFHNGVRWIARTTSEDFLHWGKPENMSFGDAPNEHLYTNQTRPYFRAPHIYIGTAARFHPKKRALTDEEVKELDLYNAANYGHLDEACSDSVLLTSRGGMRYDRTFLEAFIRPGLDLQDWVARSNYPALSVVPTSPREISIYIQRRYGQPSTYLERLTLRTDGFASIHAPYAGGEATTKPFRFSGKNLAINFATSAAGSLHVEIQNAAGEPIRDYTLEDADSQVGDRIQRIVTWKGNPDLSRLRGKTVRLRFKMKDADLYSIQFVR